MVSVLLMRWVQESCHILFQPSGIFSLWLCQNLWVSLLGRTCQMTRFPGHLGTTKPALQPKPLSPLLGGTGWKNCPTAARDREWKSISGLFSYLFTTMFSTTYFSNLANVVHWTRTQRHKNPILAPQQSFLFFQLTLTCLIPGSVFTCSGVSYSIYCLSCAVVWIISSTTTQFCSLLTILLVMWDSWLFIKFQCSLGGCPLMLLFPKQKQTSSHCFLSPSW